MTQRKTKKKSNLSKIGKQNTNSEFIYQNKKQFFNTWNFHTYIFSQKTKKFKSFKKEKHNLIHRL